MKDKTKKIIAGIGLGAVLGTSGLFMTGCTEIPTEDMTKIMETVDNINVNIDELQTSVEGLRTELTKEKIYDLMRLATAKINMFDDNVYSNVKLTYFINGELDREMKLYKMDNDRRVCVDNGIENGDKFLNFFVYELDNGKILTSSGENKQEVGETFESQLSTGNDGKVTVFDMGISMKCTESIDNIIYYELLENGNYKVVVCLEEELGNVSMYNMLTFEITSNAQLISVFCQQKSISVNNVFVDDAKYLYEYGVLTETEMQGEIDKINALPEATA